LLGCPGELSCGKDDDFSSLFIHYYYTYREQKRSKSIPQEVTQEFRLFPIKAVVFDFDGTLTNRHEDKTTWERIWSSLGYDLNDCAFYHTQFSKGVISHEKWCDITCQKFRDRNLSEQQLLGISETISLIPGTTDVLRKLREKNIRLFILSGSIKAIIRNTLGELYDLFEEVKANDLIFGEDATLREIIGTKYDFKGKADFLRQVMKDYRLSPLEVLFIGNSCNDVWASESGARTLCVNPHFTDHTNIKHWSYAIRKMADLNEIMKYL
jgi:HAD superfamily phosphoserine phosphatase-like hydrolase